MIFGNDGFILNNSGNIDYFGDGKTQVRADNAIYGSDGVSNIAGNTMFPSNGPVSHSGNCFYAPDGVYVRSGSVLYGPNGKAYNGVSSDDDAFSIINHENL